MAETPDQLKKPPNCIIEIDGSLIEEITEYFDSVQIELHRTKPSVCRVNFSTTRSTDSSWPVVDSEQIRPWKTIEIKVLLDDEERELFSGYILKVETNFSGSEHQVVVEAQDQTILMDREHKMRVWGAEDAPITDGEIVEQLASEYQLSATVEEGMSHAQLNQDGTDIRFIKRLAAANGFELSFRQRELYFGPARLEADEQPEIKVYCGDDTNCNAFKVEDDGYKPDQILVETYSDRNYELKEFMPEQTRLGDIPADADSVAIGEFKWKLSVPGLDPEMAMIQGQAKAEEHAWKIKATGTLDGILYGQILETGRPVAVSGVGETHSGTYYVDAVTHRIEKSGYQQEFVLLRNARGS